MKRLLQRLLPFIAAFAALAAHAQPLRIGVTPGSLADSVHGGVGALTFTLVGNATGQYGQILLNADGSYTYTLTSAPSSPHPANDGANTVTESFTYQVKDSLGNTVPVSVYFQKTATAGTWNVYTKTDTGAITAATPPTLRRPGRVGRSCARGSRGGWRREREGGEERQIAARQALAGKSRPQGKAPAPPIGAISVGHML